MILNLYSVYDQKTQVYNQPFVGLNENDAMRMIQMLNMKGQNEYNTFPEDYQLRHIGRWDNNLGLLLSGKENPRIVCDMVSLVTPEPKKENQPS